jgi:hypothetical protein
MLRNKMRVDVNIVTEQKKNTLLIDYGPAFNGAARSRPSWCATASPARPRSTSAPATARRSKSSAAPGRRHAHRLRHQQLQGPRQHPHQPQLNPNIQEEHHDPTEKVSKTYQTDKVETLALKDIDLHVEKANSSA